MYLASSIRLLPGNPHNHCVYVEDVQIKPSLRPFSATKIAVLLLVLAAICSAQWHHFSEKQADGRRQSSSLQMLAAHNALRARLKLPPLVWSDRLSKYAQEWADRLAVSNRLFHRTNATYGENLFLIHGAQASPADAFDAWASEARYYDYQSNSCQGRCGHYTQLIWRDTKRVGCGNASKGGTEVWVCNYDPPGNFVGERPY